MSSRLTPPEPPLVLSVSQLNRQAKGLLESHFDFIWVTGEVSNLATPSSGHWYFTLKDGSAQVRCAMFRNRNQRLRITPQQGDEVRVRARVSLYEGRGEFQLIVEHLELSGEGALQAAFDKLKQRLAAKGLFDAERKQPLPTDVSALGVITSASGAALHDILTVLARRSPRISVYVLPVQVQGEGAAAQIADAIALANRAVSEGTVALDALIVGRGGGSLEDLWAFNEEVVAHAIAASEVPVVSAVGHEVDFSIADFVADVRAPTPSAAAEMLSPDQEDLLQWLASVEYSLVQLMEHRLSRLQMRLENLRLRLKHPGSQLREQAQRLDTLEQRLLMSGKAAHAARSHRLTVLHNRLLANSPNSTVRQLQQRQRDYEQRLDGAMQRKLTDAREQLAHLGQMLNSLSPLAILQRGYAIVTNEQGQVVTDAGASAVGAQLKARLAKGSLGLTVDSLHQEDTD